MKRLMTFLTMVFAASLLSAATLTVQDNYKFIYTVADTSGDHVTGQTVTLKIMRGSDGQFFDFSDSAFKASGWTAKTANLTEDTTDGYYYYLYNPPASETGADQYVFIVDNADATYGDHQSETVSYQANILSLTAASYNTTGTVGAKINSAASAGDPWETEVSTTAYTSRTQAGNMFYRLWKGLIR